MRADRLLRYAGRAGELRRCERLTCHQRRQRLGPRSVADERGNAHDAGSLLHSSILVEPFRSPKAVWFAQTEQKRTEHDRSNLRSSSAWRSPRRLFRRGATAATTAERNRRLSRDRAFRESDGAGEDSVSLILARRGSRPAMAQRRGAPTCAASRSTVDLRRLPPARSEGDPRLRAARPRRRAGRLAYSARRRQAMSAATPLAARQDGRKLDPREEHFRISSQFPGLGLFLRHLSPVARAEEKPKIVLYVHGATFPSALSIAHRFDGRSWRDELVDAGFHGRGVDVLGI